MKKVSYILSLVLLVALSSNAYSANLDNLIKTTVNDEPLNVRNLPSIEGEKVGKLFKGNTVYVTGFSDNKETIDGYNGYWVKVSTYNEEYEYWEMKQQWVFSKYLDLEPSLEVSKIEPVRFYKNEWDSPLLDIKLVRKNGNSVATVELNNLEGQDFYSFNWLYDYFNKDNFSSCDPTGTFVYYPSTNEIKHITVKGESEESSWGLFTNDFKYFLQDFGTSSGVRALLITDLTTNEEIFSGNYYKKLGWDGESITICETNHLKTRNYDMISKEERRKAEEKQMTFSYQERKGKEIVDCYRYNLYTGEITFLDCILIAMQ